MAKKIALKGFDRVSIFPITQNDAEGYAVGERIPLPHAEELTREVDKSESKFFADDVLYLNVKNFNGLNATLTLTEMTLEMMEKLGFGKMDAVKKTFSANPQGESREFAVTFRCKNVTDEYRLYKYFCFTVEEIKETGAKTMGDGVNLNKYQVTGTFTRRAVDGQIYEMSDSAGAGIAWLDTVEAVPEV